MKGRIILTGLLCALMALLSGCLFKPVNELYTLPQQPVEYDSLQSELKRLLSGGAQYSAPAAGDNLQAVQMADLTGDGVDEVLVFLKTDAEKPLQVCIYQKNGAHYETIAVLSHSGNSFDRVDYVQLDGEPGLEIVLGTQVSAQVLQSLHVYTVADDNAVEMLNTNYFKYTTVDFDMDGKQELLTFCSAETELPGVAELFCYYEGCLQSVGQAALSMPLEAGTITRIRCGYVQEDMYGVFVAQKLPGGGLLTDIFALRDGIFSNITAARAETGDNGTIREGEVYCTDIDDDGFIELPSIQYLQKMDSQDLRTYYLVDWYNLDSAGNAHSKMTTYYNESDGWYLEIPEEWKGKTLLQYKEDEAGQAGYHFYYYDAAREQTDWLCTIYQLQSQDMLEQTGAGMQFVLAEQGERIFAAALCESASVTQAEFCALFHLIQVQWSIGQS